MTSIPVVWKKDDKSPPEWVLMEMQGELQFKEHLHMKSVVSGSTIQAFQGLEMGVLAPHAEHGPTRPELRIGNLVIQGRLVQLPKPLLVLTTRRLKEEEEEGEGNAAGSSLQSQSEKEGARSPLGGSASKRKRGDAGDDDGGGSKKPRSSAADSAASSSASSSSSTFPSACLQTVAVIRHKYTFTHRPYAICDMGAVAPTQSTAKQETKTHTTPSKTK